jgi:hypothetical protein
MIWAGGSNTKTLISLRLHKTQAFGCQGLSTLAVTYASHRDRDEY